MVKLYHGSSALFAQPDFSRIKNESTLGTNEYGWGFYASDYAGDAWERLPDGKGFVYEMDVADETFRDKWINANQPAPQAFIDRAVVELDKRGKTQSAEYVRNSGPLSGHDLYTSIRMPDAKSTSEFWADAGFDGFKDGAYYVFLHPGAVPELNLHSDYKSGPNAKKEFELLKAAIKPLDPAAFAQTDKTDFRSEVAERGYRTLKEATKNPALCKQYADIIEMTKDQDLTSEGFSMREKLGYIVTRAFTDPKSGDAYFGTTLLDTSPVENSVRTSYTGDFGTKFENFIAALKEQPRVSAYLSAAGDLKKTPDLTTM